jgi:hypothetical protein
MVSFRFLVRVFDPVLWVPWCHKSLRPEIFLPWWESQSMIPEGLSFDHRSLRSTYAIPCLSSEYILFEWWNALGSEQWNHCVLMDMRLPRKHCLTSTIWEQLSILFANHTCSLPNDIDLAVLYQDLGSCSLPSSWICRIGCSQINGEGKLVGLPSFSGLSAYRLSHISFCSIWYLNHSNITFDLLVSRTITRFDWKNVNLQLLHVDPIVIIGGAIHRRPLRINL